MRLDEGRRMREGDASLEGGPGRALKPKRRLPSSSNSGASVLGYRDSEEAVKTHCNFIS